MPVNNNDTRVKRTKKMIRNGLIELSKTKCITKITVKELTDLIEINRGTFYLHYKDISELVDAIEEDLYNELKATMHAISSEQILKQPVETCEAFCEHFRKNIEIYSMLMGVNGDAKFTYEIGEFVGQKVYMLFKGIFPNLDDTKYDFAYNFGKFGFIGLVNCWCTQHPEWTTRQVAEMWLHLTTMGLWGIISDEAKEVLLNAYNSR